MSPGVSLAVAFGIATGDTALVLACRFVRREPFVTIDRWLAAAWAVIYRATGAVALDRAINRRRDARDITTLLALAGRLETAGLAHTATRCRSKAWQIQAASRSGTESG